MISPEVQAGRVIRLYLRLFLLLLAGLLGPGVGASQPQSSHSSGLEEKIVRLDAGNLAEGINGGIRNLRSTAKAATSIDDAAGATAAESGGYRATVVTPEIDAAISKNRYLSGRMRSVTPNPKNPALPLDASLEERLIQYLNGTPFPRDANFVAFSTNPELAVSIAERTGRSILQQPWSFILLDRVNLQGLRVIGVENVFRNAGVVPRSGINIAGEHLVEGAIAPSRIIETQRIFR